MKLRSHCVSLGLKAVPLALISTFAHAQSAAPTETQLQTIYAIEKAASSTEKVNFKALEESTANEMKEVLSAEPSINFGGGNGTSQWVTIRGMGQDQIDIKVDNTYSDTQMFHHNGRFLLDPALIKDIEVQKGTGSASAGIGATSGAIVARTASAKDLLRPGQTLGFKVNGGFSSNKGRGAGVAAYGQFGALDALVNANWTKEENYKSGGSAKREVQNSALGQRGLLAKFGYALDEQNRIELSHRQEKTHGVRALREEFDFSQANNDANNAPRYRIYTQDTTRLAYTGRGLGPVDKIETDVYRMSAEMKNFPRAGSGTLLLGASEVETQGANINLDSYLFNEHILKYGVNLRRQEAKPGSRLSTNGTATDTVNERKTDYGVYAEGIWNLHPVTLTTGLRYDHFKMRTSGRSEVSDGQINPSIAAIYDLNEQVSFNAGLSYATRSPRLYEAMLAGGRRIIADNNLEAERARTLEAGVTYTPSQALRLAATVFHQNTRNHQEPPGLPVHQRGRHPLPGSPGCLVLSPLQQWHAEKPRLRTECRLRLRPLDHARRRGLQQAQAGR